MRWKMSSSVIRHGLCIALLTVSAGFGLGACGSSEPTEDEQVNAPTEQGAVVEGSSEDVAESEEALSCGYQGWPGAHCLGKCCQPGSTWVDLGNPGSGNCHEMVNAYCHYKGGNCGQCWGWL
jgi:hypothetical protein